MKVVHSLLGKVNRNVWMFCFSCVMLFAFYKIDSNYKKDHLTYGYNKGRKSKQKRLLLLN